MRREEIPTYFLGKRIKLVKNDGFTLNGTIIEIKEESLVFETDQATSMIDLSNIRELVLKREGCYGN